MSLFKTKEWWRTKCGSNEIFDKQNLLVAPLLGPEKKAVIVVGNNKGFLRIYNPLSRWMEAALPIPYTSKDLIIEVQFPDSIIDLKSGRFISGTQKCCLAVLLPKKLVIYDVHLSEGSTGFGDKCNLEVKYEHQLSALSMSMTVGPFGKVRGKDFICIQYVDGTLLILEQELNSFTRNLKNRLQHEPLVYLETDDVFVTQNFDWLLSFYRYQNIAEFGKNINNELESERMIEADFKYNLGEAVLSIDSVTLSSIETGIIAVSERNLYIFHNTNSSLKFTKRLAYNVLCIQTYIIEPDGKLLSIVVTDTKALMVYEGSTLKWSAQVPFVPIAISMIHSQEIKGLIVILSDDGDLEVCFLGSQPSLYIAPSIYRRQYNYVTAESELLDLRSSIRKCVNYGEEIVSNIVDNVELKVSIENHQSLVVSNNRTNFQNTMKDKEREKVDIIALKLESSTFLNNVQLYVEIAKPWIVCKDNHALKHLCGQNSFQIQMDLEGETSILSSEFDIVITYENDQSDLRFIRERFPLDMKTLFTICPPENMGLFKIDIETEVLSGQFIKQLLNECMRDYYSQDQNLNSFGVKLIQKTQAVTMTFGPATSQIHVHSDDELVMFLVLSHIINRIPEKIMKNLHVRIEHKRIHFMMEFMKTYSLARQKINKIKDEITILTSQVRNIIKKMIHIRERNFQLSADIGLLTFLKMTCQKILTLVEAFMDTQMKRIQAAQNFYCVLQSILSLLRINVQSDIWENLESSVGFQSQSEYSVAWEDVTGHAFRSIFGDTLKQFDEKQRLASVEKFNSTQDIMKVGETFSHIIDCISATENKIK